MTENSNSSAERDRLVSLRCRPPNGKTEYRRWMTASEFWGRADDEIGPAMAMTG